MRPIGEWNQFELSCDRNLVTVRLNGASVILLSVHFVGKMAARKIETVLAGSPHAGIASHHFLFGAQQNRVTKNSVSLFRHLMRLGEFRRRRSLGRALFYRLLSFYREREPHVEMDDRCRARRELLLRDTGTRAMAYRR